MPPGPPEVTIGDLTLAPITAHWIVGGAVADTNPQAADGSSIQVQTASVPPSGVLDITIGHPTLPPTVYVTLYDQLDARHHPTGGAGRHIDCTETEPECQLTQLSDHIALAIDVAGVDAAHRNSPGVLIESPHLVAVSG